MQSDRAGQFHRLAMMHVHPANPQRHAICVHVVSRRAATAVSTATAAAGLTLDAEGLQTARQAGGWV